MRASTTDFDEARGRTTEHALPPRSQTVQDLAMPPAPTEHEQSSAKQRPEPNKLQRRQRTYSFSPGRRDSIGPVRRASARTKNKRSSAPETAAADAASGRRDTRDRMVDKEADMMDDSELRRVPTLHNKREGDHLARKKSSKKRRRDDREREAEIKAMSNYVPPRRVTDDWPVLQPPPGGRRLRSSFGLGFKGTSRSEFDKYNRSSDLSIPPESIHSAQSSDSEYISFKVSALEALAPRPTLRYATHPRPGVEGGDSSTRLARSTSRQQRKLSAPIPEATLKAHKRIHDLADELSASDLRELMERDQRRRERKRQRDQERLEQRLARRAEKQRAAEAEAKREGRDSPANLERGVLGREALDFGPDTTSAVVTSSRIRQSDESLKAKADLLQCGPAVSSAEEARPPHPLAAFHRTNSIPLQSPELPPPPREPKPQPSQPLTSPRSRTSFIRLKLSRSSTPQGSEVKTEHSELQQVPEATSPKSPLSWASFLRWGNKHKHQASEPASFSNTSRDSMPGVPQAPTPPLNFIPRRISSGVPKRTMSRFREDLPDFPISPPDSRVQSPEAGHAGSGATEPSGRASVVTDHTLFAPPNQADDRNDTPTSEQRRSMEAMRQTPSSFGHPDEPSASPELQTMSLASIDSEGSWLSGKMSKRRHPSGSLRATPYGQHLREASESDVDQPQDPDSHTIEDMSITEDDYLARVTNSPGERPTWNRKSTGDPRASSDEEETRWGAVRGQQPEVVHSHPGRVKSSEVLLNSFGEEAEIDTIVLDATKAEVEGEDDEEEAGGLQRATSINLSKGHVRHISAGSARLLSISPRSSVDGKRLSSLSSHGKLNAS